MKNISILIKSIIGVLVFLALFGCDQKDFETQEETVNTEASTSEKTTDMTSYPRELNEEEITAFFNEMKGSWHSFNPPLNEYDINYLALVFYPKNIPLAFYDGTIEYEYNDLMIYGVWIDMPDYKIGKAIQTEENTWNLDLEYIEKEYFTPDICSSLSITKENSDTIIVIMQKEDAEESTYPVYGKEYTFSKISDGYEVSTSYYLQWVKENGYKSIYVPDTETIDAGRKNIIDCFNYYYQKEMWAQIEMDTDNFFVWNPVENYPEKAATIGVSFMQYKDRLDEIYHNNELIWKNGKPVGEKTSFIRGYPETLEVEDGPINIRADHDINSEKYGEALEGSSYLFFDVYEDDEYVWYKVYLAESAYILDKEFGWMASSKKEPWISILS